MANFKYKIGDHVHLHCYDKPIDCIIIYIDHTNSCNKPYLITPLNPDDTPLFWIEAKTLKASEYILPDGDYKTYIKPYEKNLVFWAFEYTITPIKFYSITELITILSAEVAQQKRPSTPRK